MRRGKFELKETEKKKWYFVLKASNGRVIATSEIYESRKSAENGIRSIRFTAPFAKLVVVRREILQEA